MASGKRFPTHLLALTLLTVAPAVQALGTDNNEAAKPKSSSAAATQTNAPSDKGKAALQTALPAEYVLGVDDVIEVSVSNHPDLNKLMTIPPDGKITLPELGDVTAAGKTRGELAHDIERLYEDTLNNAKVTISVHEVHSKYVNIVGAVRAASRYDLKPGWHLMELLTAAGGLSAKPNRVEGSMIRGGSQLIKLDVAKAIKNPDSAANVALEPGDMIVLNELTPLRDEVHVAGQVNRVGAYALDDNSTLLTVLTEAGGPTDRAALTKAYVTRGNQQIPLNLRPALGENKPDEKVAKFKLEPGDVLTVPEIENRYAVLGQVGHPAYYPIPEKGPVTAFEALNFAGGGLPDADLSKAYIIRKDPSAKDGKPTFIPINMNDVRKRPEMATSFKLQPEDMLFVPPRGKRGLVWQDALTPLTALSWFGLRLFH